MLNGKVSILTDRISDIIKVWHIKIQLGIEDTEKMYDPVRAI